MYQTVQELSKGVQKIYHEVQKMHKGLNLINDTRANQSRKESDTYFDESIKKYLKKIIDEDSKTEFSEVYTELSAKEILPISLKFRDEKSDKTQDFKVLELVEKEEKLIVSGGSGSGKTTTLKWLNFTYATNCLEKREENIPLYIELNSYIKGPFYNYVKIKAKRRGMLEDTLKVLMEGKAILFLDGFDLLSPKDDFLPYDEISNFISEYSNCRFVISSRPGFFDSVRSDFKVSELEKLTDEKIQIFIEKYVEEEELAKILKNKILDSPELKSILTNPMMLYLSIKVAMGRNRSNDEESSTVEELFPQNRSDLYETFVSYLFKHNEGKGKPLYADRPQIENSLTNFYFELQCRNKVSCKYKEALQIVKKHSEDPTFRKTTPQDILDDSIKIGLLTRKDSEIGYGIHQSFQEYFAAIKLKELFETGSDISEAFSHPKWEEVVIFTSEMVESVDEFINLMLSKGELFLASKCVNKASDETKEKLCALLTDKMDSRYDLERINSIESLGRIGTVGISRIDEALKDEDVYVQWSAVQALGNIISETEVQPLINALKDEDLFVRWSEVEALKKIYTVNNKNQLEDLLDSEHELSVNTAFEILDDREKEEKSKIILFEAFNSRNSITPKCGIFVSSVQKELENERVTVQDLVENDPFLSAHYTSLLYEYEPASPEKTLEGCLNALDSCQVYLLIIGVQYGTLVGEISITHAEYRHAKEKGLPILVFIKGERNVKREQGIEALLRELDSDSFKYKRFRNVIELKNEVKASLEKLLRDEKFIKT